MREFTNIYLILNYRRIRTHSYHKHTNVLTASVLHILFHVCFGLLDWWNEERCVLPGGDAVPGGAGVEVLSWSFQDGAVSSELIENYAGVNSSCADAGVLKHFHSQSHYHFLKSDFNHIHFKDVSHTWLLFTNRNQRDIWHFCSCSTADGINIIYMIR